MNSELYNGPWTVDGSEPDDPADTELKTVLGGGFEIEFIEGINVNSSICICTWKVRDNAKTQVRKIKKTQGVHVVIDDGTRTGIEKGSILGSFEIGHEHLLTATYARPSKSSRYEIGGRIESAHKLKLAAILSTVGGRNLRENEAFNEILGTILSGLKALHVSGTWHAEH